MKFTEAAEKVKTLSEKPNDNTLLRLYGLYKQVTVGNCSIAEPWAIQVEAWAKWNAWNQNKGKSKQVAENEYVVLVENLLKKDIEKLIKQLK
jgi:diazepam-binding inhibitor (GABA receptor modulating acyl-CoA-binding protein)